MVDMEPGVSSMTKVKAGSFHRGKKEIGKVDTNGIHDECVSAAAPVTSKRRKGELFFQSGAIDSSH